MESIGNSIITILQDASLSSDADPNPHIFSGTPADTTGYSIVHTLVSATHPGQVHMMQSIDNSYWDIDQIYEYPNEETVLGTGMFTINHIKARWYRTEFHSSVSMDNYIRVQSIFHADNTIPTNDVRIVNGDVIPVTISGDTVFTISGGVTFPSVLDVNVTNQPYVLISGQSIDVFNTTDLTTNVTNVVDVRISDQPVNTTISNGYLDISILHQPIDVNVVNQTSNNVNFDAITDVWESEDISNTTVIYSNAVRLHTIHGMNFAPDGRFVKLYDICGNINPQIHRPRYTFPLTSCHPQYHSVGGGRGLLFSNAVQVRITRLPKPTDMHMGEPGDVLLSLTYTPVSS